MQSFDFLNNWSWSWFLTKYISLYIGSRSNVPKMASNYNKLLLDKNEELLLSLQAFAVFYFCIWWNPCMSAMCLFLWLVDFAKFSNKLCLSYKFELPWMSHICIIWILSQENLLKLGLVFPFHFIYKAFDQQKFLILQLVRMEFSSTVYILCVLFWESAWTPKKKRIFFSTFSPRSLTFNHLEFVWVCMYVGAYGFYSFRMEGQWSLRSLWNGSSFTDWLVTSPLLHVTASAIKENAVFKRWKKILCKQSNNLFFPQRSTGHIPLTRMVR